MFTKQEKKPYVANKPTDKFQVTDNLVAAIWEADRKDGQGKRYNWDIGRLNPEGGTYSTKTLQCLLELPEFAEKLCAAFANQAHIERKIQADLLDLAQDLSKFVSERAKKVTHTDSSTGNGMFASLTI